MSAEYIIIAVIAAIILWKFATGGSTPGDPDPGQGGTRGPSDTDAV